MALALLETTLVSSRPPSATFREATPRQRLQYHEKRRVFGAASVFNFSTRSFSFRLTGFPHLYAKVSPPENSPNGGEVDNEMLGHRKVEINTSGSSFLAKLVIAVGIAATVTIISLWFKKPTFGPSSVFPYLADVSSVPASSPAGLPLTICGYRVQLPEYTPGISHESSPCRWIYFWLLMAAGCGLFISEEALNIWVGICLARSLCLDGTWRTFVESLSSKAPYIISTVVWVYWGVCISDMIPFYLGKLVSRTKASDDVCSKIGITKEKVIEITQLVRKYGNLIGFVERFSLGVRNPTAFLAGALGISPECFFAGVCCGGLITLPIQLGIGFLLRERPVVAVASVATAVGIWTLFPYVLATSTALFLFLRKRHMS